MALISSMPTCQPCPKCPFQLGQGGPAKFREMQRKDVFFALIYPTSGSPAFVLGELTWVLSSVNTHQCNSVQRHWFNSFLMLGCRLLWQASRCSRLGQVILLVSLSLGILKLSLTVQLAQVRDWGYKFKSEQGTTEGWSEGVKSQVQALQDVRDLVEEEGGWEL